MTTYNTIPDDEALLAPKKQKSFKGLVAGAAMASFLLGMVAVDKCLESDKSDCGGVTVAWTEDGNGTVECYLRSNIDIGSCEDGQKDKQWYSTFTRD